MAKLLIILLFISCVPEQKSGTSAINPMAPSRWNMNAFPINLKASAAFTASERQAIDDSALSWDASIAFGINFFDTTGTTSVTQYGSLGPYLDSEMGIYKSTSWPSAELPSNALAITQIFGYRKLTGTANEYVEIFHADIILNDMAYDFSADFSAGTYDLETVLIHEMGHFIGLYHVNDPFIDSVMYPSVTHSTIYRSPYTYDADSISSLYGLATAVPALLGGSGPNGQAALPHQDFMPEEEGPGEPTIIQMELMPSGSCIHKQDGKIIAVH